MGKGKRNREIRKRALVIVEETGENAKSVARRIRRAGRKERDA